MLKEQALKLHEDNRGKIEVNSKIKIETKEDLSLAYSPGVAQPCLKIAENPDDVYKYTSKGNLVAVVSDGSAVLGLGNIGALAGLPVMEGKSILFKRFGGIDAFPICLNTQDTEEIIKVCKAIAPNFGGINLEDISSPRCFEIEQRLEKDLDIPVFHDDQHGTAIVVTAALMNAVKLTDKQYKNLKVVVNGPGAAGVAIINMLLHTGIQNIVACDEHGILYKGRNPLEGHKEQLCNVTNLDNKQGDLADALVNADVFIGVSAPNVLTTQMIKQMSYEPIVFAMANPVPEIGYDEAKEAGVKVMATGRSDYPNQVNNVLAFPGIFKGALQVRATQINYQMKIAAAQAIASIIEHDELTTQYIIPSALDARVAERVAQYVAKAAVETGVAKLN
ncbi:MAG: malate dehydrogenase [Epulopiscium sp. Nele67-Bin002]|nr:MAG: malate dehydrogenase [Epulopiscium sp. Nuni2H_MBin001]OON91582.1 MAG: malate dehydrogenase [Epulopiscium sp. Nele67-Bin002]